MEQPIVPARDKAQMTSLLSNDLIHRIEQLRLNPRRRLTNRARGEHLSGKGGSSIEFSDYRDYVPGDDVRYVDWNIFARLNRPYLKQYRHEEEMHVVLIVDGSTSMLFEDKHLRARQLAAAFGIMGLLNFESVSAFGCNHAGKAPVFLPACRGRVNMRRLFAFFEELEGGGDYPIELAVETVMRRHRGRGIAVILSDFLTVGDLTRSTNMLFSAGLEIFAIQLLSPTEISPEITGDVRFVDAENGVTLDISSAGELLGIYHEHRQALEEELTTLCRQRNGRFLSLNAADSVEWMLCDLMLRRGWVQ